MKYHELADRLISVFFPQRCLSCGEVVAYDDFWCGRCSENGKSPYVKHGIVDCAFPRSYADALAAVQYDGEARKLILRLKKKPDKRTLLFFTREICGLISEHWSEIVFDAIIPVPGSKTRTQERGFNTAESLAQQLGRCIGIPVYSDALIRFDTQAQHGLTAEKRRINAAESYAVGKAEPLAGKTVLLADDVFTTGATAEACAHKLLEAGAACVYVVAAAFTKYNRNP